MKVMSGETAVVDEPVDTFTVTPTVLVRLGNWSEARTAINENAESEDGDVE